MRHRLISPGGEIYLPFAESAIRKLKKLGLPYANQTFIVDGYTIYVRVEPEHEYIRIEGGCSLALDSGVVELFSTALGVVEFWNPVMLYETVEGASYTAGFTKLSTGSATDESKPPVRTNPGKGSHGQVAGLLTYSGSKVKGAIPTGRAKSFAPYVTLDDTTEPAMWKYVPRDDDVAEKKQLLQKCPASLYNGRCRNYVQSMYGVWLHPKPHKQESYRPVTARFIAGVAPRLVVTPKIDAGDTTAYPEVIITVSSCVYLNPVTGEHWLINPSDTDEVSIYPLVSSSCCESMRKILVTPLKTMTQADVDRVESYILAHSLPVVKKRQLLNVSDSRHSPNAMGYGWHWNMRGTTADRVILTHFRQERPEIWPYPPESEWDPWGVESEHFRLSLSHATNEDGETVFSISPSTLSKSKWAVNRGMIVLLEPSWYEFAPTRKSTPDLSAPFTSSGVFYVFYLGDTLQRCTVNVVETETIDATFSSSDPQYANGVPDGNGNIDVSYYGRSYGFNGGSYKHEYKQGWHHTVSISVGPVSHSGLVVGQYKGGVEDKMSTKRLSSPPTAWGTPTVKLYGAYLIGDPYDEFGGTVVVLEDLRLVLGRSREVATGFGAACEFDVERYSYTETISSTSVIGVSATDSEAVFIQSIKSRTLIEAARTVETRSSTNFLAATRYTEISTSGSTVGEPIYTYKWWDNTGTPVGSTPADSTQVSTELFRDSKLVCREGVVQCNDDWDLSPTVWYYEEDFCYELFGVVTGANSTVAIPQRKFANQVGLSVSLIEPAIVGYA